MISERRQKGVTVGVWTFGSTWPTDLVPILRELGYSSMVQTEILAFKFGEALVDSLRFESLQSRPLRFLQARKPEDIWLSHLQYLAERNFTKKPNLVVATNCHYFRGSSDRLVELAQALNHAGVDVILVGEPGSTFDQVFVFTDVKLRAHEPCQHRESPTREACGRQALKRVWYSVSGKSPALEFAISYLEHFLPVAKLLRLEKAVRSLILALKKVDVKYPKIPRALEEWIPGIFINILFVAIYGVLEQENRCRAHLPGKERPVDRVGQIHTFIGPPDARKSFSVASFLEQTAGGRISASGKVKCYSALPRGTDSTLVGYEPEVIKNGEEIRPENAQVVSFDEAELFHPTLIHSAIALADNGGRNVLFALHGRHWDGKPAKNAQTILSSSEVIVNCWAGCFMEGCGEIATRTTLMSVVESQINLVPGSLFPEVLVPAWIKARLGIKIVPACLNHCDQATSNQSFDLPETNEPKSDLGKHLRRARSIAYSITEDAWNGRASAVGLLVVATILLFFPDLSYTIWSPLHKVLMLAMSVAFVLTISAVCDLAISQKLRKKRQKSAYVTLGFATILILLATLYLGLETVITTAVRLTAFMVGAAMYWLGIALPILYSVAGDYLQKAELPGEYGKPLVNVSLGLLSLAVIYGWFWIRRKKKARRGKIDSKNK